MSHRLLRLESPDAEFDCAAIAQTGNVDLPEDVELPQSVEMVTPGDNVQLTAELISPIAMDDGLRFTIREGERTVGAGVVTKILKRARSGSFLNTCRLPAPQRRCSQRPSRLLSADMCAYLLMIG